MKIYSNCTKSSFIYRKGFKEMKKIIQITCNSLFCAVAIFIIFSSPQVINAESFEHQYCELSIRRLKQEIGNFGQLISLAMNHQKDRKLLIAMENEKKNQFQQARSELNAEYGMTEKEYATYMGENARNVKKYLETHPDIKSQIDDLSAQKLLLLKQYEEIKNAVPGIVLPVE